MKLTFLPATIATEVRWLRRFETCVPKVYEVSETLSAFMMEYIEPGESLRSLVEEGNDDQATRILSQTIRDLQAQKSAQEDMNFPHLSTLSLALLKLDGRFDAKQLSQAKSLFRDLTEDRSKDIVLHGDLHHTNLLEADSGWKVIDPMAFIGPPEVEVGAMIRNPIQRFPNASSLSAVLERRVEILSEELPFDPERIKAWTYCMTVLSIAWEVEGNREIPRHQSEIASALYQLSF